MWTDLPHTVQWRRRTSHTEWEGDGHADPVTIAARIESRTRLRQTATGEERVDETRILVGADYDVSTGDMLGGEIVEATDEQTNLSGDLYGRICYLESRST